MQTQREQLRDAQHVTPENALEKIRDADSPAIVTVDLRLHGDVGRSMALLRRLAKARSEHIFRHEMFIVAVSSLPSRDEALEAGADFFVEKGIGPQDDSFQIMVELQRREYDKQGTRIDKLLDRYAPTLYRVWIL